MYTWLCLRSIFSIVGNQIHTWFTWVGEVLFLYYCICSIVVWQYGFRNIIVIISWSILTEKQLQVILKHSTIRTCALNASLFYWRTDKIRKLLSRKIHSKPRIIFQTTHIVAQGLTLSSSLANKSFTDRWPWRQNGMEEEEQCVDEERFPGRFVFYYEQRAELTNTWCITEFPNG